MEILIVITLFSYVLSTGGYFAFFFLKNNNYYKTGYYLLLTGLLFHTAAIIFASVALGHIPVHNLRGTILIAGWIVSGVFLIFQFRYQFKALGIFAAPLVTLLIFIVSLLPSLPLQTKNVFNSFWLVFHIVTVFIGDASFALACGVGVFYIVQERAIKLKKQGIFFNRLPSLEFIDNTGYGFIAVGFTMLTIGLVTGMIYAKSIWGHFWSWDPKEIWSGITWLMYAALFHGRISLGWRGRKAAIMSIVGFGVLLFTFLGVNLLLTGHHAEFTKF